MTVRTPFLLSVILAVTFWTLALGYQDTDFYYQGFVNPNTENPLYYKDSYNVLQDLGQFSALYIRYHGCV